MTLADAVTQQTVACPSCSQCRETVDEPEMNSMSCHISIWKRTSFHSVMVIRQIKYENGNPIWKDTFSLLRHNK